MQKCLCLPQYIGAQCQTLRDGGGNTGGNGGGDTGGNAGGDMGGNAGGDTGGNAGGDTGGNAAGNAAVSAGTLATSFTQGMMLCLGVVSAFAV